MLFCQGSHERHTIRYELLAKTCQGTLEWSPCQRADALSVRPKNLGSWFQSDIFECSQKCCAFAVVRKQRAGVEDAIKQLPICVCTKSRPLRMSFMNLWKVSAAFLKPKDMHENSKSPDEVMITVLGLSSKAMEIWWYALTTLIVDKIVVHVKQWVTIDTGFRIQSPIVTSWMSTVVVFLEIKC